MVSIYCIEDINDLKYVGSTTQPLQNRLSAHKADKRNLKKRQCTSSKLNLEYCIIYELESCDIEDRYKREEYWILKLDCVNIKSVVKCHFRNKIYKKNWYKENKERILSLRTWGGDPRFHNNLLKIDVDIFN